MMQTIHGSLSQFFQMLEAATLLTGKYFKSLIALARAREVYINLSEAEVDLNVISNPLWSTQLATAALLGKYQVMKRAASFILSLFREWERSTAH